MELLVELEPISLQVTSAEVNELMYLHFVVDPPPPAYKNGVQAL